MPYLHCLSASWNVDMMAGELAATVIHVFDLEAYQFLPEYQERDREKAWIPHNFSQTSYQLYMTVPLPLPPLSGNAIQDPW